MLLPELVPGPSPVDVQHTTFSADAVSRHVCSTRHEVIHNGRPPSYHGSGTLWMGTALTNSVNDTHGRFHHVSNAYACDQSIFPTVGSANPVLNGLTLARRLAEHIT